jgi:hypothetical protein
MITRSFFLYIHTLLDRHIVAFWLGCKKYEKIKNKTKIIIYNNEQLVRGEKTA